MVYSLANFAFPNFDPIAVHLGPLAIRWYGIAYVLGFALGYLTLLRRSDRGILRLSRAAVADLVGWVAAGVVIGGRLGWWLVYDRPSTEDQSRWYEPFAMWHGGMSFHGGLVGVAIAAGIWSWRNRAPFWNVADNLALVAPIGLFFGRIANFINAELVGRPTNMPWGVVFPGETFARHPSQLYEAVLEGPALLALIIVTRPWCRFRDGRSAGLFLLIYGIFRAGVEITRQPDVQVGFIAFGWLTMGQLLSVALVIVGVGTLLNFRRAALQSPAPLTGLSKPGSLGRP
jgi:phosphatidylglycerol:prolipoprotein diacylglycerol transferase